MPRRRVPKRLQADFFTACHGLCLGGTQPSEEEEGLQRVEEVIKEAKVAGMAFHLLALSYEVATGPWGSGALDPSDAMCKRFRQSTEVYRPWVCQDEKAWRPPTGSHPEMGDSILHVAVKCGCAALVDLLLREHRSLLQRKNALGKTVLQTAEEYGQLGLIQQSLVAVSRPAACGEGGEQEDMAASTGDACSLPPSYMRPSLTPFQFSKSLAGADSRRYLHMS